MSTIAELAVNAVVNTQGVTRGTSEFRREMSSLHSFVTSKGAAIATAVSGALAAGGAIVAEQSTVAENLQLASDRLGTSVENLSRYRFAAKEAAEMTSDQLDQAIQKLNTNIGLAARGAGKAGASLEELGLDAEKLAAMQTDQRVFALADALAKVSDSADRTRLAEKIGGDGQLAAVLAKGSEGLRELAAAADLVHATVDGKTNKAIAASDQIFDEATRNWDMAKREFSSIGIVLSSLVSLPKNVAGGLGLMFHDLKVFLGLADDVKEMAVAHEDAALAAGKHKEETEKLAKEAEKLKKAAEAPFLQHQQDVKSDRESLRGRLKETRDKIATHGLEGADLEIAMLKRQGGDRKIQAELIEQLHILGDLEKAKERQVEVDKKRKEQEEQAARVIERSLGPLGKLKKELDEIADLHAAGRLTDAEADAAAEALKEDEDGSQRRGSNAAVRFGSSEAFKAIRESRGQEDNSKKTLKTLEKANEQREKMIEAFKVFHTSQPVPANWN